MIDLNVDAASVERVDAHLQSVRDRLLQGIRTGMLDAMVGLAATVADKLHGDPIHTRTGALLAAVMASPRVMVTETSVRGMVSSNVDGKPLGSWLEDGVHEPATTKLLKFMGRDGSMVFSRGHRQFYEMGKPFLMPSLEESKQKIFETIRDSALQAVGE